MRRLSAILLAAVMFMPTVALAGKAKTVRIATSHTVETGTPYVITLYQGSNPTAYLAVGTSGVVATPSLVVTIAAVGPGAGAVTLCTFDPITTATTTWFAIGTRATAGGGITTTCSWPLPDRFYVIFTTSGVDASIDVTADIKYLYDGGF